MQNIKRPILKIEFSILEKVLEVISVFSICSIFLMLCISWGDIPARIPTHFGISGQPNAWGSKVTLVFMPIVIAIMYILLSVISRFPHIFNYIVEITETNARFQYQNAREMICWLKLEIILFFGYIEWVMVLAGLNKKTGLGLGFLPVYILVLIGTLVFYIYRMGKCA